MAATPFGILIGVGQALYERISTKSILDRATTVAGISWDSQCWLTSTCISSETFDTPEQEECHAAES